MDLLIRPDDLYAASVALARCGSRLDDASVTFARRAQLTIPDLGASSTRAAGDVAASAERAVEMVRTDIARLSQALAGLAEHYGAVDNTAMPGR